MRIAVAQIDTTAGDVPGNVALIRAAWAAICFSRSRRPDSAARASFSARSSAWIWLVIYIVIPPMLLAAFVMGERAGGRAEYAVQVPLRNWTRMALAVTGAPLTILGMGLAFSPGDVRRYLAVAANGANCRRRRGMAPDDRTRVLVVSARR